GNWVQAQQLSWEIQAHENASQQGSGLNNTVLPPMTLAKSQYVAIAEQDATAVGIPPAYFVRQIQQESGFNPNAVSPAGAVGIAQFEPGTAAGLGINPLDPIQALKGAATLMANYARQYGGDYAKALAAYNGGSGTVQSAVNNCGANWLNCLPGETRHYIYIIMGI
ncbi:MAG: lytic transglycosylase domain-containing protein, partial [Ktedonobacteraceae bacterium]